ncbi:MAG: phosphatase PAP2 family protein [Gammaproteobacteria bacterium]|nr:phosphatase PAP2 family protein [Gammaproteobacteria bacterium]MCB1925014.1 phosphatase PAP2 family protein [Gammaproteobacteria bacterium]
MPHPTPARYVAQANDQRRMPLPPLFWPTVLFVYALLVLQLGGLDEWIVGHFYDPAQHRFPWRHRFLTETLLHDGGRRLMLAFAAFVALAAFAALFKTRLRTWRRRLVYLLIAVALSVALVNLGKRLSNIDCPWDLAEYGGDRAHYGLFAAKPASEPVGHCFPGGHSSSGFSLFALYFVGLASGVRRPRLLLLPALLLGAVFAADQWARGAHFPSHDLTTAYLCWLISLLTYRHLLWQQALPAPSS